MRTATQLPDETKVFQYSIKFRGSSYNAAIAYLGWLIGRRSYCVGACLDTFKVVKLLPPAFVRVSMYGVRVLVSIHRGKCLSILVC